MLDRKLAEIEILLLDWRNAKRKVDRILDERTALELMQSLSSAKHDDHPGINLRFIGEKVKKGWKRRVATIPNLIINNGMENIGTFKNNYPHPNYTNKESKMYSKETYKFFDENKPYYASPDMEFELTQALEDGSVVFVPLENKET